ncbi:MAG: hypothetical protein QOG58_4876 [Caballeronia sp.]|nr:hypothetical protein [Caballeronia sp.]
MVERSRRSVGATIAACHAGQDGVAANLAGADLLDDRLGRLALSVDGLARRDSLVFSGAAGRDLAVAITIAGDYGRDIDVTVDTHLQSIQLAAIEFGARRDSNVLGTLRSGNFI